ncbi:MFS transporter [uncultured Desulfobacter sp.]|uniref:MFS transporter n=1 Tax=uncultured Desulfobacter sp. TaxID=240139 RepID=UPI0029C62E6F|nr:MFS transporter [uncultured Desulfobacter sp.]
MNNTQTFQSQLRPLLFLTAIFFLNFSIRIIISPLLPTILQDMSLTGDQAGSLFLVSASGYFITLVCSGFISEILLHKKTIGLSAIVTGFFFIITGVCNSLTMMRAGIFITGMGAGLYLPSGIALITAAVSRQNWGKALGVHELAPNLSFLLVPIICEALLLLMSWRSILMLTGMVSVVLGISFLKFSKVVDFPGQAPMFRAIIPLLFIRSFWIMIVLFTMGVLSTIGIYSMLPLYLVDEHGMLQSQANTLIALSRILTLPVAFTVGWISDRYGIKRTLSTVLILTGIFTLGLGVLTGTGLKTVIFLQPLLSVAFFPPAFSALSSIGAKETRNIIVSFTVPVAFLIGGGAAPTLIGFLAANGFFSMGFIGAGITILMFAFLPIFLKFNE